MKGSSGMKSTGASKNLVIVESPAKAKTIEGFLGKEFIVKSSYGHVMDLNKTHLGVDIENGFKPQYEIDPDKKKVVADLKKSAQAAETIWLASDEDREGEAISWHLFNALGLKEENTKRIVFHEITKQAITKAIDNPRSIDINLVSAQQARRVLDRLVGYELSPLLWKKVKPSLSAGRVQSVAVRLIVEREDEIREFNVNSSFRVIALFEIDTDTGIQSFEAELPERFKDKETAWEFLQSCIGAQYTVHAVEKKPAKKSPAPPFTTSTLQQEASRKLGFSVANTMRVAQQLYESGKITYMRTDSVNLSAFAIEMIKQEIIGKFGENYSKTRRFVTKTKGAQEAHEAIRPTYMDKSTVGGSADEKRLYELIWKRTIASQMADAKLERTTVLINISTNQKQFTATGEVVLFDGFLKVYFEGTDEDNGDDKKNLLPPLKQGQQLTLDEMNATERFTRHPARYTEASLVKKMEELGIGRPSTYAPTISTILKREYVVKEDRPGEKRTYKQLKLVNKKITEKTLSEMSGQEKAKLFPTDVGTLVNRFLIQHFENIIDYHFTAHVEKEFDEIADGKKVWNKMIGEFYESFHRDIVFVTENAGKFSGEKLLGIDPASGKNVFAKVGRYGPMIQIGDTESEEKPRFAGLRKDQSMETISLEEALKLFEFPRHIGTHQEKEVIVAIGRFGPYVKFDNKFYSLQKTDDPHTIDLERAITLIEVKQMKEAQSIIKEFDQEPELKVLDGRYGPYIRYKNKNYKIPKQTDPAQLTLEQCKAIIADPENTPKKRFVRKKTK
ncbi:MAG: type I DNA topoisomerase [Bacteroidales bacterium]|jgi:DNA topoisomerase-1|nr:type I DNA topoisomerase [Bacteroidales bacterium]MDD3700843.1 type I DNA topoisomerase [Bacteroidales bacterium]MDY0369428.1 type I DNA topoisomerase [Bacteroidales bacterium]